MAKQSHHTAEHGARATTDHDEIRKWVEARGGRPATVKGTATGDEPGLLRIDFPGGSGEESRFCKFVGRETAKSRGH